MLEAEQNMRFEAYLGGTMSPEDAEAFENALLEDETLLSSFERYAAKEQGQDHAHAASNSPQYIPPSHFTEHVRDRIRRRSGGRLFQEDPVTTRYIPMFVAVAFIALVVVATVGYVQYGPGFGTHDAKVVDQDAPQGANGAQPGDTSTQSGKKDASRETDRTYRRQPSAEAYMRPASDFTDYKDLPLSKGRLPAHVTYTEQVLMFKSAKSEAELRAEITKNFGNVTIEKVDDYLRVRIGKRDLAGAHSRLNKMKGTIRIQSEKVPAEEAEHHYLRFYYDVPKSAQ